MYGIFTDIDDSFLMVHFHATCRFARLALVAWDISWLLKRNCQLGPPSKNQCITPTNRLGALLHLTHCSIQYCFAQTYLYSLSCFTVLYSYLASFTGLLTSNRLQHTRVRSTGRQVHPGSWVPWYSPNFWTTPISPVLRFNKTGEGRDEGVSIGKHIRS